MNIDNESTYVKVRNICDDWRLDENFGDDLIWRDRIQERRDRVDHENFIDTCWDVWLCILAAPTYVNTSIGFPAALLLSSGNIPLSLLIGFGPYAIWILYLWRKDRFDDFSWWIPLIPFTGIIPFIFLGIPWIVLIIFAYITGHNF